MLARSGWVLSTAAGGVLKPACFLLCCCTSLPASFSRRLCVLLSYLLLSDLQESEGLGHRGGKAAGSNCCMCDMGWWRWACSEGRYLDCMKNMERRENFYDAFSLCPLQFIFQCSLLLLVKKKKKSTFNRPCSEDRTCSFPHC